MLPEDLRDWLVTSYLQAGLEILKNQVFQELFTTSKPRDKKLVSQLNSTIADTQTAREGMGHTKGTSSQLQRFIRIKSPTCQLRTYFQNEVHKH